MKASILKVLAAIVLALCVAPVAFSQVDKEGKDQRFYDDLLDHLVGTWEVDATVHGQNFTLDRKAEWVMSHQYLRIYEKSRETIPWLKAPFERTLYIGYNHGSKRYVVYELTVHGGDVPHEPEGFYYGERTGNELKMAMTKGAEVVGYSRLIWEPDSQSWRFQGGRVIDGKEQAPLVDQKAVAVGPSPE